MSDVATSVALDKRAGNTARWALAFVIGGLLLNLGFNLLVASYGLGAPHDSQLFGHPFNSFLYDANDRFGDTLKMALTYPGPEVHPADPRWGLNGRLAAFEHHVGLLRGTQINHFHMLPLSTLIGLGLRAAMSAMDPGWLLVIVLGGMAATLAAVVGTAAPKGESRLLLIILALICYPALFAFDRGHLFSLICASAVMAATFRCLRDRRVDWVTILLFAIALNIRPNAGLLPLGLFLCRKGVRFHDLIKIGFASLIIFLFGMLIAHQIYPPYSFESLREGLRDYSTIYVSGSGGQNYNSSLFGAIRGLYGYHRFTIVVPLLVQLAVLTGLALACWRQRVPDAVFMFLLLSAYVLGGQVLLDYHLIVFVMPLVLLALNPLEDRTNARIVMIGCCLLLIPKNYISHVTEGRADWTFQVIFNPLIMLLTSMFLLYRLFRFPTSQVALGGRSEVTT
ncbi:MAG: hypothetical protein ABIO43_06705 [Sphingomicrobium sp.]